ncbi:MAG: hypothetical protein WDW38_004719 [Sanguina aurantia]
MSTRVERGVQGSSGGARNRGEGGGGGGGGGGDGDGGDVDGGHDRSTQGRRQQEGLNADQPRPRVHPSQKAAAESTSHTDQGATLAGQSALERPDTGPPPSRSDPPAAPSQTAQPPDPLAQLSAAFTAATTLTEVLSCLQALEASFFPASSPATSPTACPGRLHPPRLASHPPSPPETTTTAGEDTGAALAESSSAVPSQPGADAAGAAAAHHQSLPRAALGRAGPWTPFRGQRQEGVVAALACAAVRVGHLVTADSFPRTTVQLVGAGSILDDVMELMKRVPLLQHMAPYRGGEQHSTSTTPSARPEHSISSASGGGGISTSSDARSGFGDCSGSSSGGSSSSSGGSSSSGSSSSSSSKACAQPVTGTVPAREVTLHSNSLPGVSSRHVHVLSACQAVGEPYSTPLMHHVLLLLASCPTGASRPPPWQQHALATPAHDTPTLTTPTKALLAAQQPEPAAAAAALLAARQPAPTANSDTPPPRGRGRVPRRGSPAGQPQQRSCSRAVTQSHLPLKQLGELQRLRRRTPNRQQSHARRRSAVLQPSDAPARAAQREASAAAQLAAGAASAARRSGTDATQRLDDAGPKQVDRRNLRARARAFSVRPCCPARAATAAPGACSLSRSLRDRIDAPICGLSRARVVAAAIVRS